MNFNWLYGLGGFAVLFIILFNCLSPRNNKRRGVLFILVGLGSALLFAGLFIADAAHGSIPYNEEDDWITVAYFVPAIAFSVSLFASGIVMTILGSKSGMKFSAAGKNYSHDVNQYLYVIYKYEGIFYLKKKDDKFSGDVIRFDRGITYYDDMFNKYINDSNFGVKDSTLVGTATDYNSRRKTVYYCFLVELNNITNLDNYTKLDPFKIVSVEMNDVDKKIILKILLNEKFNIEL